MNFNSIKSAVEKIKDPVWETLNKELYAELAKHYNDLNDFNDKNYISLEDAIKELIKIRKTKI